MSAQYDSEQRFLGYWPNECGGTLAESHTGGKRAWCSQCSEWCYPQTPCRGCELPALRARLAEVEEALTDALHRLEELAAWWDSTGAPPPIVRRMMIHAGTAAVYARAVLDKGEQG